MLRDVFRPGPGPEPWTRKSSWTNGQRDGLFRILQMAEPAGCDALYGSRRHRRLGWDSVKLLFFSSRRRHTRFDCDWSSDVCSSDLRNGNSILGIAAINGVRRAALIDLAAMARCTTRKSVHQYPNDNTNPRPITSPNHSTPTGLCAACPM